MLTRKQRVVAAKYAHLWQGVIYRRHARVNEECPLTSEVPPQARLLRVVSPTGQEHIYDGLALYLYLRDEYKRTDPFTNREYTPAELLRFERFAAAYCSVHTPDSDVLRMPFRAVIHFPLPSFGRSSAPNADAMDWSTAHERGLSLLNQIDDIRKVHEEKDEREDILISEIWNLFVIGVDGFYVDGVPSPEGWVEAWQAIVSTASTLPVHKLKELVSRLERSVDSMCQCDQECANKHMRLTMIKMLQAFVKLHEGVSKRKREAEATGQSKRNRLADFAVVAVSLIQ